jgi:hypothetical protein
LAQPDSKPLEYPAITGGGNWAFPVKNDAERLHRRIRLDSGSGLGRLAFVVEAELAAKSSTSELKGAGTLAPRQALRKQAVSPHRSSTPQTAGRQVGRSAGRQVGPTLTAEGPAGRRGRGHRVGDDDLGAR